MHLYTTWVGWDGLADMVGVLGRIAGEGGKVKFSIENASRTRIVLAET